jgi:hypothetical protein
VGDNLATFKELADNWGIYLMLPVSFVQAAAGLVGLSEWCSGGLPPKAPRSFLLFRIAALGFLVLSALTFIADGNWFLWISLAFLNMMIVNSKKKQLEQIHATKIELTEVGKS